MPMSDACRILQIPPSHPPRRQRFAKTAAVCAAMLVAFVAAPAPSTAETPATTPSSTEVAASKPQLVVEERVHDTGEVARDKVVEHSFKIRNAGNAPLVIESTVTAPNLEILSKPAGLAPGETGEIRVRVPLLLDRPMALLKQVEVRTNDPETPSVVLELRILSTEYVVSKPGYARWIAVQHEKAGTISQRIVASDGQDFELLKTSEPPLGISSKITSTRKDPAGPREWQVDLTLGADAPVGPIVGNLLLYVNHPKQSIVPIPLSGFMRPVMAVTPPKFEGGEIALVKAESQAFYIKAFSTEPIFVTKVEHDIAGLAPATFETVKEGREYKARLHFDPVTTPKGRLHGTLKVFTSSAKVPSVSVPIDIVVK